MHQTPDKEVTVPDSNTVGIVGGGIGGLMSACLLASDGYKVSLFEKNAQLGGKMDEKRIQGYRFDTGPSLLTMPFLLETFFTACGESLDEWLKLKEVHPICRYNYADGQHFDCYDDINRTAKEIDRIAPEDRQAYLDFLDYIRRLYDKTADAFLFNTLSSLSDLKGLNLTSFFSIDAFKSVSDVIDERFSSPYLRQFFKRFTTYNGSSPYSAPGTLNVIPHVELNIGGYYIQGGMHTLVKQLEKLANKLGVRLYTNCDVRKILVDKSSTRKKIQGIEFINSKELTPKTPTGESEQIPISRFYCNKVVSNSDAYETYQHLLPRSVRPTIQQLQTHYSEPSCSGFVLLLGLNHTYDQLKHHNIFFSADYKQEFHDIFNKKQLPDDPTIYVANTSFSEAEDAPNGGSNLFILVNAPYLNKLAEDPKTPDYAQKIISELERRGLTGLSKHIQYQEIRSPFHFYDRYRSNKGSIYGTSSNGLLSAFLRPRNRSKTIDGLFLTGGSVHPGGGIPLVLQSAFNVQKLLKTT